ncbi:hypothetical protein LTR17_018342 [Elasticomyces elasticus]|nr:hypothetical protein LTR17_018342 [Elasticomyces elasticus]
MRLRAALFAASLILINLAAQSLLAATVAQSKAAATDLDLDTGDFKKAASWIASGPLGKVHRLVKCVLASPMRREEFGDVQGGKKVAEYDHLGRGLAVLLCDNATQWNSWHRALTRVLDVKERLNRFIKVHQPNMTKVDGKTLYFPAQDKLSPKDLTTTERIQTCIETFYAAIKLTEGYEALISEWYPTLQWLLSELDNWKVEAETWNDNYLLVSMTAAPTLKMQYFRDQWSKGTVAQQASIPWVEQQVKNSGI